MSKRVVILAGGKIEDYSWYRDFWQEGDYLLCADSGVDHARKLGVVPQLIVGDLDSAEPENIAFFQNLGSQVIEYEQEKDQTDTQIALKYAKEKNPQEIIILGAIGDRLDHTLSNLFLLTSWDKPAVQVKILNETQEIFVIREKALVEGRVGEIISLLPLTPWVKGIRTEGLKYTVKDGFFSQDNPYGVSNELTAQKAWIELQEGLLLLIKVRNR